ncbi:MAG: hypothetical protein WC346_17355 [Methanogenium sp.]
MKKYKVNLTTDEGELIDTWDIQIFSKSEDQQFNNFFIDPNSDFSLLVVSESELYREHGPFPILEEIAADIQFTIQNHFKKEE